LFTVSSNSLSGTESYTIPGARLDRDALPLSRTNVRIAMQESRFPENPAYITAPE
jgi:hypothetical protein